MLRGLRKASANWLGKAIMAGVVGFLIISFAIWGIGDIFRGFGRSTVAKIGRTEISIEQFRSLFNERLQQFSRQLGRPISIDQARAMGLDRLVINQLVSEVVLDETVRRLGLGLPDSEVSKQITTDPAFLGPNGQFDRFRFEQTIRNAGYTEARFIAEQRRRLLRRQLAGTIASGMEPPKALIDAVNRYQNEQRSIEYVLLDSAQAGDIPAPSPEELAKYFEERKILFRAPEFRKVVIVSLIPGEQARWIEISDADIKRAYEERRSRYITPERRHIEQIDFPSLEAAQSAAQRIAQGASFADVAKELGKSEKDIDLGILPKAAIIDRAVGDAAFALAEGEVSAPVKGRFGFVLVRVLKIEPEQVRSLEEVAGELKQELALARAKSEIHGMYDRIEDLRGEGKTLAEAAAELKLPARTISEVDRSGRDASGAQLDLPDPQRLIQAIFTTDVGVERDPIQVQDGYMWFEVIGITPSRERTLEEAKDQVEQRWRDQERATRLDAKATQILDKLQAGSPFGEAVEPDHLKVETLAGIKRGSAASPLGAGAAETVFRTPKDAFAKADAAQIPEQVVFRVTDVIVPAFDPNSNESKQLVESLQRALSEDVFAQYVTHLENEIGVTINQAALTQAIGGGANPGDVD
jgi:peptidyl-prolyl cis-trans isomerase D